MNESLELLKTILTNYGVENVEEIIEQYDSSNIENNIPFKENPLVISANAWLEKRGFDNSAYSGMENQIMFYPIKENGKTTKFYMYQGVSNKGVTKVLDKINKFDVSDSNFIQKSTGRASVDSFVLSPREYGNSIGSNKTSQTIGTIIDEQFTSEINRYMPRFKFNNEKMIELSKNKVLKQNHEIAQMKHFESFRVFSTLNELQTNIQDTGIIPNDFMNNPIVPFADIIKNDLDNINQLKDIIGLQNREFVAPVARDNIIYAVENKLNSYGQYINKQNGFEQGSNSINNLINFDSKALEGISEEANLDAFKFKRELLANVGLENFAAEFAERLTKGQKDYSKLETSEANINFALYQEILKQQSNNKVKGSYLNEELGLNLNLSGEYTIDQIQKMDIESSMSSDKYIQFKNHYTIKDNKVIMQMPTIANGKLFKHDLNLNISEVEFNRYMNMNFRMDGNLITESLIKNNYDENQIKNILKHSQELIKGYQSGQIKNKEEIFKQLNYITSPEIKEQLFNTILKGNDINVSNIINRSQSMLKGNSQFFNHSIQGSLSAFNKMGARPWQALETLDDVLVNVTTKLSNGQLEEKTINITKELIKQKAKQNDYIVNTDFIKNGNLRGLSNAENNFISGQTIETRDSLKGLFFDTYATIDNQNNYKFGQIAFNESMYLNKNFSDVLQGKQRRFRDFRLDQFNPEIQERLKGITDPNKINDIFNELSNNNTINQRFELLNLLPDSGDIEIPFEKVKALKNFYKQNGIAGYKDTFDFKNNKTITYLNKKSYIEDIYNLSDTVINQMDIGAQTIYANADTLEKKINFMNEYSGVYDFLKKRKGYINNLNNIEGDMINISKLSPEQYKSFKVMQQDLRMKGKHFEHLVKFKSFDVNKIRENILDLSYNKTSDPFGLSYNSSYMLNNVVYNDKTGIYTIGYDDITTGTLGTKVHMNDGFKGTVSGVMSKLGINIGNSNYRDIAGVTTAKTFQRAFDGGSLYSTIETSLWLSNKTDTSLESKYFNSLKNLNHKGKNFNLFEVLGIDVNKTNEGYNFFDSNSGLKNYQDYNKLANPDAIDNPHLISKINSTKTVQRLKELGINSFQELDAIVNNTYESYFKGSNGYTPIYVNGAELNINGTMQKVIGKLSLKSLAITGANQNTPSTDALKIDGLLSRFFDSRGFGDIGSDIRRRINERNSEFLNQYSESFNNNSLNILRNKNIKLEVTKSNSFRLGLDLLKSESDLMDDILFGNMSFNEFMQRGVSEIEENGSLLEQLPSELRKSIVGYIKKIEDPNAIRSIPTITYSRKDLLKVNQDISNTFKKKMNILKSDTSTNTVYSMINNYYESMKEAVTNGNMNDIKILNKNNSDLVDVLNNYKDKNLNKNLFGIKEIISEMTKTNDVGELSKILNVIENPDRALNYNFLNNGVFVDPKTNQINLNPIRAHVRNLMDLESYNGLAGEIDRIHGKISETGSLGYNLKKSEKLRNYYNSLGEKDIKKLTNIDIAMLKYLNKDTDRTENIQRYFSLLSGLNNEDIDPNAEELVRIKTLAENDLAKIISGWKSSDTINLTSDGTTVELQKAFEKTRSKIFRSIYGADQFKKDNLTRKDSFLNDYRSVRSTASFSEQAAEGSNILSFLGKKLQSEIKTADGDLSKFYESKIYKDTLEVFGEDVTDNILLRGVIKNNKIDTTKIYNLQKQIEEVESLSFISKEALKSKSQKTFNEIENALDKKTNSFFGFMFRAPAQSSENLVPTMNYFIDLENNENSIIQELKNNGFGRKGSSSIMILGKHTAARMKHDNDGDKLYLSLVNSLLEDDQKIEQSKENIKLSVYLSNDREYNLKRYEVLGFDVNSQDFKKIKNYYTYYNALNDIRTKENIDSHYHIGNMLFGVNSNRSKYYRLATNESSNERYTILKELVHDISEQTKIPQENIEAQLIDYLELKKDKKKKTVEIGNKIKNPFDFQQMQKVFLKDTNVGKTGIVYTNANRARNVSDVLASMDINSNTIDNLARSIAQRSGDEELYGKIISGWEQFYSDASNKDLFTNQEEFIDYINKIKDTSTRSSYLTFEAIEMGVISGKHDGVSIYEEIERLTKEGFKGNKIFNFDLAGNLDLKVDNLEEFDIMKTKEILRRLVTSDKTTDKDLLKILGISLDSKMYQEKALSKALLSSDLNTKLAAIEELNMRNVQNINVSLMMTSEYLDNLTVMSKFNKFIASAINGTKAGETFERQNAMNPLMALGKLLGIDIGQVTRNGNDVEINELLENQINNIFINPEIEGEQMLSSDTIIRANAGQLDINPLEEIEELIPEEVDNSKQKISRKEKKLNKKQQEKIIKAAEEDKKESAKKISEQVADEIKEQIEDINKVNSEKVNRGTEEIKSMFDKAKGLFKNKKRLALGAAAVMMFTGIGYATGRRNTVVEDKYEEEELGVGINDSNLQYQQQNNIGY